MDWIINVIGISCMGVLWVMSEPTILLRNFIYGNRNNIITRLLECPMCVSFHMYWVYELIVNNQLDIMGASICSISAAVIEKIITHDVGIV